MKVKVEILCSYLIIKPYQLLHVLNFNTETLHINEYHLKSLLKGCGLTEYARTFSCHE